MNTDGADYMEWADILEESGMDPQSSFEDSAVRRVLSNSGILRSVKQIRRELREQRGTDDMDFVWFHAEYPNFPMTLGARRIKYVHKIDLSKILKSFTSTPIFKEYVKFHEERGTDPKEETAGLIFPYPGHTMMVIHNLIRDDEIVDPHKQWARITRPLGTTSPPVIYTIEPLEALLQHIRTFCEWVYDE